MRVSDFDFDLPDDRIALRPVAPRDHARLLLVAADRMADHRMFNLPALLRAGDTLVVNDTRVIPAQLFARHGGAAIGVTLHRRLGPWDWIGFVRNARRLREGDRLVFGSDLSGEVIEKQPDGAVHWRFESAVALEVALERAGQMPLPPYIARRRAIDSKDADDYQTMFAQRAGAVAAPTAGLHFTPPLLAALAASGVAIERLTLHVGAGTFLPVKADRVADHRMHSEWGEITAETQQRLAARRAAGARVIAVGTTSLRLLEAAQGRAFAGSTDIFITPGHRFGTVDGLLTNFHLPRSTLFMLVSALMGLERMQGAYAHAIDQGYRFYSYGDGSLLLPGPA
jgi:S-adenosylmethionine:tRNA ribosyltransferase-isomerase